MRVEHRPAVRSDVDALLARGLPESNIQEIRRVAGTTPEHAVRATFDAADYRVSSWLGDEILALWGVSSKSIASGAGTFWLIASQGAAAHPFLFARESRRMLRAFDGLYAYLENHVDADNGRIVRWLKWLGFTFDPEPVYSATGHQLLRFWR